MKNFFVITNPYKDRECHIALRVMDILKKLGANADFTDKEGVPVPENIDCVIVIGGDGTLVRACESLEGRSIHILGINAGTLGFLAVIEEEEIEDSLNRLINDNYGTESRMMLAGSIVRNGKIIHEGLALNDVVITRSQSMQILHYHLYVNGQFIKGFDADGIIIATPTGSTGYNLSAGGPIVEPTARLLLVTPICPHTINTRSIVLSAEDEVTIEMVTGYKENDTHAEANFDGAVRVSLDEADRIVVKMSDANTSLIRFSEHNFLETVHKKIM